MSVRGWITLSAAGALLAAAAGSLVFGATGGAAPSYPLTKVLSDPFADGIGGHQSAVEPSIIAVPNPARAGNLAKKSTILATEQVGRVYNGGASDIGYEISVNGGESWKHGELPITMSSGVATTCAGALQIASDTVTAYDAKHDVWLASYLGASSTVPAVLVSRGTVDFATKDIVWSQPICTHTIQPTGDSPDKNWITCDDWPNSKGYGNCYEEYDNNGNGNRLLMQVTHDGGLTWDPAPTAATNTVPGNGNTGDVTNETTLAVAAAPGDANVKVVAVTNIGTTLAAAASPGDTSIKVASVAPFVATTLAAAASAGDTSIKVASVQNLNPGQTLNIDSGASLETRVIASVGTAGSTGTGVTLTSALGSAHASSALVTRAGQQVNVDTGAAIETETVSTVGTAGAAGTGVTLTSALASAHASGAQVNTSLNVDVDPSGGNQETVLVTNVGTAGATGTGVSFTPALARPHANGAPTANSAAPQAGRTGGIGGVPLVQPPPPGAPPGSVCGRVIVPIQVNGVSWFSSSDCGAHWSASTQILPNMTATHTVAQNIRTSLLPTSAEDGAGALYVVWQTRSFRVGSVSSTPNDIALSVMPAPSDGQPNPPFGAPAEIPIDGPDDNTNTNDHFVPGISADPNTSGATAHLGLFYYNYPVAACNYLDRADPVHQCDMRVGFVSSTNGGATWSAPTYLADMALPDLVRTTQGLMVGDYSTANVIPTGPYKGNAISAFAVGLADQTLDQPMYVVTHGLPITGGALPLQQASKAAIKQALSYHTPVQKLPPRVP